MIGQPSAEASAYVPGTTPRVAVAPDGSVAAVLDATRLVIVEIPTGTAFAELSCEVGADAVDIAWVGTPPRLLVIERRDGHSYVRMLDPHGMRVITELRLEHAMRMCASVGAHALVVGSGTAVLTVTDTHVLPYQFPARSVPLAAGAAAGQFVVALSGVIEEWDPQSRIPKRRLRLPRPAVITALGGSDRLVWLTTQSEPARIDVIPLVNRGQPKAHDLPEPIASISGHPRSDLVVCLGAETGRVYVVDLDGRTRLRIIGPEGIARTEAAALLAGRSLAVVAAQAGRPLSIVRLGGRDDAEPARASTPVIATSAPDTDEPRPRSTLGFDDDEPAPSDGAPPPTADAAAVPVAAPVSPSTPFAARPPARAASGSSSPLGFSVPKPAPPPSAPATTEATQRPHTARGAANNIRERISGWRERLEQSVATSTAPAAAPAPSPSVVAGGASGTPANVAKAVAPAVGVARDGALGWRGDVVAWARAVIAEAPASTIARDAAPAVPAIEAIAERFALAPELVPALVLLYGAHLAGERGAAPIAVARALGGAWDDALGRGALARSGVVEYAGSRVVLSGAVQRALDELAPTTGTLVGMPGAIALLGPCCIVAGDEPLPSIAERVLGRVGGAVLAADPSARADELFVEACARGAVPMLRADALPELPELPALVVVTDDAAADALGLPRLA